MLQKTVSISIAENQEWDGMLMELVDGTVGVECFSAFGLRRADSMTFSLALDELVSSVFATDSQVAFPPFTLLQHPANINSSLDVCQTSSPPSAHAASGM
jgi:hypothetical protein